MIIIRQQPIGLNQEDHNMSKSATGILCTAIAILLGLILFSVAITADHVRSYVLARGPVVNVYYKGWNVHLSNTPNSVVIDSLIAIGANEILIDGQSIASVPQGTNKIDALLSGDYVDFVADGKTIATCLRK